MDTHTCTCTYVFKDTTDIVHVCVITCAYAYYDSIMELEAMKKKGVVMVGSV